MATTSILDQRALKANRNIAARNYWKARMAGYESTAYFRMEMDSGGQMPGRKYAETAAMAPPEAWESLNGLAGSDKAKHVVLLAVLGVLANKYSAAEDVCILSPMYAEEPVPAEGQIIAIRMKGFSGLAFREFLRVLKDDIIADYTHGHYPVERMLNVEGPCTAPVTGMLVGEIHYESAFGQFLPEILFSFRVKGGLSLKIQYDENKYDGASIALLPGLYFSLLERLTSAKEGKIGDCDPMTDQESQRIWGEFNATERDYGEDRSIVRLFEDRVRKDPERVAIEFNGRQTSYGALNCEANRLAKYLLDRNIRKGEPVAILLDRSTDLVVSVLAVRKAGAVYLPVDTSLPSERIRNFLEGSRAQAVLTKSAILAAKDMIAGETCICLDLERAAIGDCSSDNPAKDQAGQFYLLYTSGSTGEPKGVIGTEAGLLNRLNWGLEQYPFAENEVCCQKTSPGFVDHLAELFVPLLAGIPLVILGEEEGKDVNKLAEQIMKHKISRITLVPSLLRALVQVKKERNLFMESLRYVFCSGEALSFSLAGEFFETFGLTALINIYGSTEVSADVTFYDVRAAFAGEPVHARERRKLWVPIGKPLANNKILLVDKYRKLVPVGVPGEILVVGKGVSPGYITKGEEMDERFLQHTPGGQSAFLTGDMGRWLPDGNIEFLGRLDHQVKIRGNRVRLDEIAYTLQQYKQIKETVVIVAGNGEERSLIGYYIAEEEQADTELRHFLGQRLPDYMIPAYFVRMSSFPLTSSGKLDRSALPGPAIRAGADYILPSGELEEKLAGIWAAVLKLDRRVISVDRSFFELGGHSLRAMTLVNKIQGELGIEVSVRDVFAHKTVRSLAVYLKDSQKLLYSQLKKAEEREYYPLSIAQMRLQYFYELDPDALTFNLPAVVRLAGMVDRGKLRMAFTRLIDRQEILRTHFEFIEGKPVQLIAGKCEFEIEQFFAEEDEVADIVRSFIRPFDLSEAPLMRVGLIRVAAEVFYLMVDMHHIISDGTSIGLLINDFMALYNDIELPRPEFTYKDYAVWQQSPSYQLKVARQKEFWIKEFSEPLVPLDIPVDFANPATTQGDSVRFDLSPEQTLKIRAIAGQEVATISMVILSVLSVLLGKIARQEDIVVGMVVAGRGQAELDSMIGMFPVVLPLRIYPRADLTFREFMARLKSTFLSTFDNQSYQYEDLARELRLERNTSRNPWFDVMYLYQNFETSELVIPGLKISGYREQNIAAYERLNLTVSENEEQIFLKMVYSRALFRRETIERWTGYFKKIVDRLTANMEVRISDIELISPEEQAVLLRTGYHRTDTGRDTTFTELFAAQVRRTPLAPAIRHAGSCLTYEELYDRQARLASRLEATGAGTGSNVAVFLPRGPGMLTAILAIFHIGATYVPVDMEFPAQRIADILRDSGTLLIISSFAGARMIAEIAGAAFAAGQIIFVDDEVHAAPAPFRNEGKNRLAPAYIIYTSGTTGMPKGVIIHQWGMINHLLAMVETLGLGSADVVAQTASPCFDISIWQFLCPLLTGARIHVISGETLLDPHLLLEEMQREKVTIFQSVPSLISRFIGEITTEGEGPLLPLRWMIPTGEPLSIGLAKRWYAFYPQIPLLNAYGPAEAGDDITTYVVEEPVEGQLFIPVGRPIRNMQVYILDEQLKICPVGMKGEICVTGPGVGRGYRNDPEQTAKAFVPNPFAGDKEDPDYAVLFKTGDFGYYQSDYQIVCVGRRDDQVKIRGYRVELGEVQSRLLQHEAVREAVVVIKEWGEDRHLIAYYTADHEVDRAGLESFLSDRLPRYMIPSFFMHLENLPLTLNGKLNKRMLPDPELKSEARYVAPAGDTEKKLVLIWAGVLNLDGDRVSVEANFFYMGGHSLSVITLINKIYGEFSVKLSLRDFFQRPTIRSTAEYIDVQLWPGRGSAVCASGQTEVLI